MTWQTRSTDSEDTERLGELLGKLITAPEVIELSSDLGGGKTTFVRGLTRGLGSQDIVASPTFTLNKIYKAGKLQIHHFDFYRLDTPGIIAEQLAESLENSNAITVVEWSNIVEDVLPKDHLIVEFKPVAARSDERVIEFKYPGNKARLMLQLETAAKEIEP